MSRATKVSSRVPGKTYSQRYREGEPTKGVMPIEFHLNKGIESVTTQGAHLGYLVVARFGLPGKHEGGVLRLFNLNGKEYAGLLMRDEFLFLELDPTERIPREQSDSAIPKRPKNGNDH